MLYILLSMLGCLPAIDNDLGVDGDGDGFTELEGDCDDSNPYAFPGAAELDSMTDCMLDLDQDGWGDMTTMENIVSGTDCSDSDPNYTHLAIDADCDGAITAEDCDDADGASTVVAEDGDCDGTLTADDCDDSDATSTTIAQDADCDGVVTAEDCSDENPFSTTVAEDADCDGVVTAEDCDDTDAQSHIVAEDGDCDGVLTADDCDDSDATSTTIAEDADCDGAITAEDCDDTDPLSHVIASDGDCDGVLTADDCNDADALSTTVAEDADCDGSLTIDDCDDTDATIYPNAFDLVGDGIDQNCDEPFVHSVTITPDVGVYTQTVLTCDATAVDASGVDVTSSVDYKWYVDGVMVSSGAEYTVSAADSNVGDTVMCQASVTNADGEYNVDSDSVVVENTAPVVDTVDLSSTSAEIGDTLTCVAITSDIDGDIMTPAYQWYDSNNNVLSSSDTLSVANLAVGDSVWCEVSVTDGTDTSAVVASSMATIINSVPVLSTPTIQPNSGITPSTLLTCSATATDANDGALQVDYTWSTSGGVSYTGLTWQLDDTQVSPGDTIECTATVTDSDGAVVSDVSASVQIDNALPVITGINITPDTGVFTGTSLLCSATADDFEDGSIVPTYEWSVNGVVVASDDTYVVDNVDTNVGDGVICTVTATDSNGGVSTDVLSVVVENTAPVITSMQIISLTSMQIISNASVYNDDELNCSAVVDDIDGQVNLTYVWNINGNFLASGDILDLQSYTINVGDVVACVVDADDGFGGTDSQTASVTVENRSPSTPVVSFSGYAGADPVSNDTINCGASAVDPDGQTLVYTYNWVNLDTGAMISNNPTISGVDVVAGQTWECTATADDGMVTVDGTGSIFVEYQTFVGDKTLANATDMVDFCAVYNSVDGNLTIAGSSVVDLLDLACLVDVTGNLTIEDTSLVDLVGLEGLTSIGGNLSVGVTLGNANLVELTGLDNVTDVVGGVSVAFNPVLFDFTGLASLTSIGGSLTVDSNTGMLDFTGLTALTSVGGDVQISNSSVLGLLGLEALTSVGGSVLIDGNSNLMELSGFDGLTTITTDLNITNNASLSSLTGLEALTGVGGAISVDSNTLLEDIMALEYITTIGSTVAFTNNAGTLCADAVMGLAYLQTVDAVLWGTATCN